MSGAMTAQETVWMAMSDLFLDTDVDAQVPRITAILRQAPFDLATLDRMFLEDVFPVCIGNLHQIAGVWDGFDRAALLARLHEEGGKRLWGHRFRVMLRKRAARQIVPQWEQIRKALVAGGKW